jgi:choline dehydrogenase-like flavoprotein
MEIFDIAVIGAGSAGCALAGRLAARTDLRIVLVEAGPDYGPLNLKKSSKTGPNAYWVEVFLAKTPNFYIYD